MSDALAIQVERCIYLIRGEKVMLDYDLAFLYGVETKVLNRAVKRNLDRFPADFLFQLTADELNGLVPNWNLKDSVPRRSDELEVPNWNLKTRVHMVDADICLMPLLSRAWQCCPVCCTANARCR